MDYNKTKGIQLSLSENVQGSVELNQNTFIYKDCQKGTKQEYLCILIWKIQEMIKNMIEKSLFSGYRYYYNYHHHYYYPTQFAILRGI